MTHSHPNQRVSIIIPAFRGERFIADALLSVESQSFSNWEVIIVEDGSCDGTESIVNQFKLKHSAEKIRFIRHANNRGVSKARNTAIDAATGQYLAFLDCDDHWHPEHLETSLDAMQLNDADFCHSAIEFFDSDVRNCRPAPRIDLTDDDWESRIYFSNFIALSSVVIRKTERGTAGWFNESRSVNHAEDYELWLRLALERKRLTYNPRITVAYRVHPNQASHNSAIIFEAEWHSIWKHRHSFNLPNRLKRERLSEQAKKLGFCFWTSDMVKSAKFFLTAWRFRLDDLRFPLLAIKQLSSKILHQKYSS